MKTNEYEQLRMLLNDVLGGDIERVLEKLTISHEAITKFPMSLIYADSTGLDITANFIRTGQSSTPYFLIANDLIMILYMKESHTRTPGNHFNGILDNFTETNIINYKELKFRLACLSTDNWKQVKYDYTKSITATFMADLRKKIRLVFKKWNKTAPRVMHITITDEGVDNICKEIVLSESVSEADRYSEDRINGVVIESIKFVLRKNRLLK